MEILIPAPRGGLNPQNQPVSEKNWKTKNGQFEKFVTTPQQQVNNISRPPSNPESPTMSAKPSLPIISQDEEDEVHETYNHNSGCNPSSFPPPIPPMKYHLRSTDRNKQYNLLSRATNLINSVLIEEPRNDTRFQQLILHLHADETPQQQVTPSFYDATTPPYFANAIVDPDTGKELEYHQLIKMEKYKQR